MKKAITQKAIFHKITSIFMKKDTVQKAIYIADFYEKNMVQKAIFMIADFFKNRIADFCLNSYYYW
jgi:hypothetical protein